MEFLAERGRAVQAADHRGPGGHLRTHGQPRAIYRQRYLVEPGLEAIRHPGLLVLMVDAAVHAGPKRAVQWLQTALAAADQGALYGKVLAQRLRHLGRLIASDPSQAVFAAGWMNRLAEFVEAAA